MRKRQKRDETEEGEKYLKEKEDERNKTILIFGHFSAEYNFCVISDCFFSLSFSHSLAAYDFYKLQYFVHIYDTNHIQMLGEM